MAPRTVLQFFARSPAWSFAGSISRFFRAILLGFVCVLSVTTVRAQESDSKPAHEPPPSKTELLTHDIERIYGTLRFYDLRDQVSLRLSASGSQSETQPANGAFHARFITQFFVVREAQTWVNEKVNEEEDHLRDDLHDEAVHLEEDFKREFEQRKNGNDHATAPAAPRTSDSTGKKSVSSRPRDHLWNLSTDTRANYNNGVDLYAHLRLRRDIKNPEWLHSLSFDVGWATEELWTAEFNTQSNHALTEICLFSWGNSFHRSISQGVMTSSHGPSLSWSLAHDQAVSLSASASTLQIDNDWIVTDYSISSSYRWETWKNRLFFSVNPSVTFANDNGFRRDAGLSLSLEITI